MSQETKRWIDDRHYEILHNEYDDHGNLVGQKWITYQTNETDKAIFITPKWIKDQAKYHLNPSSSTSNFENSEKPVILEAMDKEIKVMEFKNTDGKEVHVSFTFKDGTPAKEYIFTVAELEK